MTIYRNAVRTVDCNPISGRRRAAEGIVKFSAERYDMMIYDLRSNLPHLGTILFDQPEDPKSDRWTAHIEANGGFIDLQTTISLKLANWWGRKT